MKQAILPFVVGFLIATGGIAIMAKMHGCNCFPSCLCSPCNCQH